MPDLLGTTGHDTLRPLVERHLLAHRADEQKWLADGVIRQPIGSLIDLMRRDLRLSRPEVAVMWPMTLLGELFKALAPQLAVRTVPLPRLEEVEAALAHKAGRLLVFKPVSRPSQSVALAVFQQGWADDEACEIESLLARVRRAHGPGAFERVVGLATVD